MSGHSKWAQIKHKKALTDIKKGKIFSKIVRIIAVATREKGADPNTNPKLRLAIEKAREVNMPKENIERAISKASGVGSNALQEMMIEAYGPGGVALIIKIITDNSNRTISELRHILSDQGGKLAGEGAVRWMFESWGKIEISNLTLPESDFEMLAIEAGADDILKEDEKVFVLTKPEHLDQTKQNLEKEGIKIKSAILDYIAKTYIAVSDETTKKKLFNLFEMMDENEDVQEIYDNLE